jgi:hypothetical protein
VRRTRSCWPRRDAIHSPVGTWRWSTDDAFGQACHDATRDTGADAARDAPFDWLRRGGRRRSGGDASDDASADAGGDASAGATIRPWLAVDALPPAPPRPPPAPGVKRCSWSRLPPGAPIGHRLRSLGNHTDAFRQPPDGHREVPLRRAGCALEIRRRGSKSGKRGGEPIRLSGLNIDVVERVAAR